MTHTSELKPTRAKSKKTWFFSSSSVLCFQVQSHNEAGHLGTTLNFPSQVISPFLYPSPQFILPIENPSWRRICPEPTALNPNHLFKSQKHVTKLETKYYHWPGLGSLNKNRPRQEEVSVANETSEPRATWGVAGAHCLELFIIKTESKIFSYFFLWTFHKAKVWREIWKYETSYE